LQLTDKILLKLDYNSSLVLEYGRKSPLSIAIERVTLKCGSRKL